MCGKASTRAITKMAEGGAASGGGGGSGLPVLYGEEKKAPKIMKKSTNKNANKGDLSTYSFNQYAGKPVSMDRSAPAWGDKDARLMKRMNVADELKQKVDLRRVNLEVIMPWITKRICESWVRNYPENQFAFWIGILFIKLHRTSFLLI